MNQPRFFISYGLFALPLAMVALPLYLMLPNYYGNTLGVNLTLLGIILFILRLVDAGCDPWVGRTIDRVGHYQRWIIVACLLLSVGMVILFSPTTITSTSQALLYLLPGLVLVYAGFSIGTITYFALGTYAADTPHARTQLSATRETCGLVGVLIAAIVPYLLPSYSLYAWFFMACLVVCVVWLPYPASFQLSKTPSNMSWKKSLQNPIFKKWCSIQALCGLSASVSATLMLFYISDVIKQPEWNGLYLATYFLCAALSTYVWTLVSYRLGKPQAWCLGIVLSTLFFSSAFFLGAGDHWLFLGVCVLTGLTLGADLVLPPALVADVVGQQHELSGGYFGVWTALNKICLALGSLSLVLWEQLNHIVNMSSSQTLIMIYVGVPVVLRIIAAILLYQFSHQHINKEH